MRRQIFACHLSILSIKLTELPVSVILTHEHYDHVASAYRFKDIAMYDNADALKVLKAGRDNASLQKYLKKDYLWKTLPKDFDPDSWTIPSMEPATLLHDGDIIDLGGRKLEIMVPGELYETNKKSLHTARPV